MTPSGQKICLNMIVKNEIASIERCLRSVADCISCWVIGDTGSTDGTQAFVNNFFSDRGIAGELHSFPFENFEQARNESLRRAKASSLDFNYLLLTDADMELVVKNPAFSDKLAADAYRVLQRSGVTYWNTRLVKRATPAWYKGVTHEYLDLGECETATLAGISFIDHACGSNRTDKYHRDKQLLIKALSVEQDPGLIARYTFYLANTLRDAGDKEGALHEYIKRAMQGHWDQEVFVSLLNAARLKEALQHPPEEIIAAYMKAASACPSRAEAFHEAARYCRSNSLFERGFRFASQGLTIPHPAEALFSEDWIYEYGLLDELSVNAYWAGRYKESLDACDRLTREHNMPDGMADRVRQNASFAARKLNEQPPASPEGNVWAGTGDHGIGEAAGASGRSEQEIVEQRQVLETDPENAHLWFRLAELYKSAGRLVEATETYSRCAKLRGVDEEIWYARLQEARCYLQLGEDSKFITKMLAAYNDRPERAEPLHDLARYYRERGMNHAGLLFAAEGVERSLPATDRLFVEEFTYTAGLKSEYSILGYYSKSPDKRDRGYEFCNSLALDRGIPSETRNLARSNLAFYVGPAASLMPSIEFMPVKFDHPSDYHPINPSIALWNKKIWLLQRCVNYIYNNGNYIIKNNGPIHTRNYLLQLDENLKTISSIEVKQPADMPNPAYSAVLGFEDMRIFPWRGHLWSSSTVRELNQDGRCEIVIARIAGHSEGFCALTDWRVLNVGGGARHEKNWMPFVQDGELRFVYSIDPARIIDEHGFTLINTAPNCAAEHFRGGSQVIPFEQGWLAVTHEVGWAGGSRRYLHRFVQLDGHGIASAFSRPFYFKHSGIEFAAGMTWHLDGKRLIISFGVQDSESWMAAIDASDVKNILVPLAPSSQARKINTITSVGALSSQAISGFAAAETNRALRHISAVDSACREIDAAGLPRHHDFPKNWDSLLALHHTITTTTIDSPVLDAGAGKESSYLPSLRKLGFRDLTGINLMFTRPEAIAGVKYERGDITRTSFPANHFGFVACLSVIEHGVDCDLFLGEMARILRLGGHLFLSFDFWPEPIETGGREAFGVPVHIFCEREVDELVKKAEALGFALVGNAGFHCEDKVIHWIGLDYTFMNLLFQKE